MLHPLKKVTMADVARVAGVAPMTVSRALRSNTSISDKKRKHILNVVEEMGYVPDSLAGALSSNRSGFVAVMLRSISNMNISKTVDVLEETIKESGLQLLIGSVGELPQKEESMIEAMLRWRPEAFVLPGGNHTVRSQKLLKAASIPIVEAFQLPKEPIDNVVGLSNATAINQMVHYLHGRGHRKIAYIGSSADFSAKVIERSRGYIQGMQELGLGRGITVSLGEAPVSAVKAGEAIVRLMSQYVADAVICESDLIAYGAIMECHRQGWNVPGDLSIAGFGNSEISAACFPGITTVQIDVEGMGLEIGRILLEAIESGKTGKALVAATHMVDHRILPRGSTSWGRHRKRIG